MTGGLPIAKYSSGSELNMFEECSFMNDEINIDINYLVRYNLVNRNLLNCTLLNGGKVCL